MAIDIYKQEYPEGDFVEVKVSHGNMKVLFKEYDSTDEEIYFAAFNKDEAIAAARAILKHFGEEDDITDRYRAPTEEEMAKFLDENPNYMPIPKEAYDPDAPLTSEIKCNLGEE